MATKMQFKRYKNSIGIILLIISLNNFMGCTKNFTAINTDPYNIPAENVNGNLLGMAFAESEYQGLFGYYTVWQQAQNLYGDLYSQYFATIANYFDSDQFLEIGRWSDYDWTYFYGTAAPQLFFVESYTLTHKMPVEHAIAEIWKVELYHRMTDYWGPIIYSQFGNGETSVGYDSQKDIYESFFKTLDTAVSILQKSQNETSTFSSNDLVFNGDVSKWIVFANSLRLRLAIRIAYIEPTLGEQQAEKAVADGVMTSNSDNANVATTMMTQNPHGQVIDWDEFRMSAAMESVLVGYNDPRLGVYFSMAGNGGYLGVRNGLPKSDKTSTLTSFSKMGKMYFLPQLGGSNPPIKVMSASEIYFLRAEGALRGWQMGGTAEDLYNKGIEMSLLERTNASLSVISDYINSNNKPVPLNDTWNTPAMTDIPVKYESNASFETRLEQIITQKWIALYPDGWEAWTERRRTGYPKGYPIIQSLNPNIPTNSMMRRLTFTLSETQNNLKAVEAARGMLNGPDANNTKLWWDAKP